MSIHQPYPPTTQLQPEQLARLRELRLWHWKQSGGAQISADQFRASAKLHMGETLTSAAEYAERYAALHKGFVQTLNDFFPADDTAERDAAKVAK